MELLESVGPRPRQARYQAALRPDSDCFIHSKALPNFTPSPSHHFYPRLCTNCARMRLLHRDCAHWSGHQGVSGYRCHFVGSTIELYQCFALHLQLHL
jgi:hypothetical protein